MKKRKVMMIDDEKYFLSVTKLALENTDKYEVMTLSEAHEVENFLYHVKQFKPDILLVDMVMPSMGGLDVCEELNKDDLGINIPIIILSALEKQEDKLKAFKLGVVDYITKPVEKKVLIDKIEKALQHKK